jgi:transcriptional regulator with GAF, ATPase, and Fis domain
VARSDVTVLLLGETGTGKDVVARLLHGLSDRAGRPFVPINCGAIPEALMESELFGHTRGAFTGASERRQGKFMAADGGTLFLDEVGELAAPLQVKLLRVLQDQVVTPVGVDDALHRVDVRVIAATNRNLEQRVEAGEFRADLFYRLNVVPIEIPPLRERSEDVPILVQSFQDSANRRFGRRVVLCPDAVAALRAYRWPGNVRELEHMIERLVVTAKGDRVGEEDLPRHITQPAPSSLAASPRVPKEGEEIEVPEEGIDLAATLLAIERRFIEAALRRTGGNRNQAAQLLKLNRTTLVEKLKRRP